MDQEHDNAPGREPSHFIVESVRGDRREYILCERILAVDGTGDVGGIPRELIDDLFKRSPLRAVALPTSGGSWRSGPVWPQSGWLERGGVWPQSGVNLNINICPPGPKD